MDDKIDRILIIACAVALVIWVAAEAVVHVLSAT